MLSHGHLKVKYDTKTHPNPYNRDGTMLGPGGAMAPPGPMRKREIYNI